MTPVSRMVGAVGRPGVEVGVRVEAVGAGAENITRPERFSIFEIWLSYNSSS